MKLIEHFDMLINRAISSGDDSARLALLAVKEVAVSELQQSEAYAKASEMMLKKLCEEKLAAEITSARALEVAKEIAEVRDIAIKKLEQAIEERDALKRQCEARERNNQALAADASRIVQESKHLRELLRDCPMVQQDPGKQWIIPPGELREWIERAKEEALKL